jgi:hypothetical protein
MAIWPSRKSRQNTTQRQCDIQMFIWCHSTAIFPVQSIYSHLALRGENQYMPIEHPSPISSYGCGVSVRVGGFVCKTWSIISTTLAWIILEGFQEISLALSS